ncbi:LON peptidase substrate-binding domain-containing protein [Sorangium sp. So ce145]|uniref:LON peptidase substrate-binding domain-containing protein n=1 Tax=Sorangium sp. So ce145 TaxID=3133285 RepID=UPI003F624BC1
MDTTPPRPGDLSAALPELPLFPLPQTVLFPGALLPLHIFEPRYRALVRDALGTHRILSVVLITDPRALDAHGHPAIAQVAGAGEIIDHAELPGGRYNIMLRGRARVRLAERPFVPPYRTAAATVLEDEPGEVPAQDHAALISTAASFAALVRDRDSNFEFRLPRDAATSLVADLCAHHLILDARERQAVLETLDVVARVRRVTEALALQQLALASAARDVN